MAQNDEPEEDNLVQEEEQHSPSQKVLKYVPWWSISAFAHAVIFVILMSITMTTLSPPPKEEAIVVSVPEEAAPEKVDIQQLMEAIDEVRMPEENAPLESPPLDAPVTDLAPDPGPVPEMAEVSDHVGAQLEDELLKGLSSSDNNLFATGAALAKLGVGKEDGPVRGAGDYGSILNSLAGRIRSGAGKWGGKVLLVWALDASLSMKDDHEAIREKLVEVYNALGGSKKGVLMAVVRFGKSARVWLKPTPDIDKIMKAFESMSIDDSGVENVMKTLQQIADWFSGWQTRKRIVCVVTDERGNDWEEVDKTLAKLRSQRITVYVIAREASFSEVSGQEPYIDQDGTQKIGIVDKGPETPFPEIPNLPLAGYTWREPISSGFGFYALSRLAMHTGGAYYMLTTGAAAEKKEYDWKILSHYSPVLCSIEDYKRIHEQDAMAARLKDVVDKWTAAAQRAVDNQPFTALEVRDRGSKVKNLLSVAESCIAELENAMVPEKKLPKLRNRRWAANIDLTRAFLYLARYRAHQLWFAYAEFVKSGKASSGQFTLDSSSTVPLGGDQEVKDREEVTNAFKDVVRRHANTPWARAAEGFLGSPGTYLTSYRVVPYVRPAPQAGGAGGGGGGRGGGGGGAAARPVGI